MRAHHDLTVLLSCRTFSALLVVFVISAPATGPSLASEHHLNPPISGPLRRSDTPVSVRSYRANWYEAFRAFSANRVLWTYDGPRIIPEATPRSVPVQCSIPFWVPANHPERERMICTNSRGGYGGAGFDKQLRSPGPLQRPDINSDEWRSYLMARMKQLVDAGCTSFQQDVGWLNVESLRTGGCYSDGSVDRFRAYLRRRYSSYQLAAFGIHDIETFDYRSTNLLSLKAAFAEFQREATAEYHGWLHAEIIRHARTRNPSLNATFSTNVIHRQLRDGASSWLLPYFDFLVSEVPGNRSTVLQSLRDFAHWTMTLPGVSAVTFPTDDVWLNQRSIASAYALGLVAIAPWDVFLAPEKTRFFADPRDFAPLYELVRSNHTVFDEHHAESDWFGAYDPVMPLVLSEVTSQLLITVRKSLERAERKAIHIVNWGEPSPLVIRLRRSDFPVPPNRLITPGAPLARLISPIIDGEYYLYGIGESMWSVLFTAEQ